MSLFESGAWGLASFIRLAGTAVAGALHAIERGDRVAAAVAASLVPSCALASPMIFSERRLLAALFYIIVFCGLTMMQPPLRGPAVSAISLDRSASRSDRPARPG